MLTEVQQDKRQIEEFADNIEQRILLWITEDKIQLIDPIQRVPLQISVSGILRVKIKNLDQFLQYMKRTKQPLTMEQMEAQIKNVIFMRIKTYVAQSIQKNNIGALEMEQHGVDCAEELSQKYQELFEDCGIKLVEFQIVEMMPTEESKERVREKKKEAVQHKKEAVIRFEEQGYCDQCGELWKKDAVHCHRCSHPILVTPTCKGCGVVFLREGKYCPQCGKRREA